MICLTASVNIRGLHQYLREYNESIDVIPLMEGATSMQRLCQVLRCKLHQVHQQRPAHHTVYNIWLDMHTSSITSTMASLPYCVQYLA